jgi:hypothetical protein
MGSGQMPSYPFLKQLPALRRSWFPTVDFKAHLRQSEKQ